MYKRQGFIIDDPDVHGALTSYKANLQNSTNVTKLLLAEAQFTKSLYKFAAKLTKQKDFVRNHSSVDQANTFLNHGNYLAYGLAATTLWVLGIPHGFAVMHGKTRRGALVFDVADLVKDSLILPWAFICAKENFTEQQFREQCLLNFTQHKSLDFMFESIKVICANVDEL